MVETTGNIARFGQLSIAEQSEAFINHVNANPRIPTVLDRLASLTLPNWYLTAGCLFQTIWNVLSGFPPDRGILDYDVFYFDDSDLSYEAEDHVIQQARLLFEDMDIKIEVRNEARVHLWYEAKFGVPCKPFASSEDAIDHFASTTCALGVTMRHGAPDVYAPYGFRDLFTMTLRPNPLLAPASVYQAKAARWKELWPELRVLEWPAR